MRRATAFFCNLVISLLALAPVGGLSDAEWLEIAEIIGAARGES